MRQLTIRSVWTLAAIALAALAVAQIASARTAPAPRAAATTIQVTGREFSLKLSRNSIPRPGKVTFKFRNAGHVVHDFRINGHQTPLTQPGKTATLGITFKKKGKYAYLCTVPGHAAAGMKGVFTVR